MSPQGRAENHCQNHDVSVSCFWFCICQQRALKKRGGNTWTKRLRHKACIVSDEMLLLCSHSDFMTCWHCHSLHKSGGYILLCNVNWLNFQIGFIAVPITLLEVDTHQDKGKAMWICKVLTSIFLYEQQVQGEHVNKSHFAKKVRGSFQFFQRRNDVQVMMKSGRYKCLFNKQPF